MLCFIKNFLITLSLDFRYRYILPDPDPNSLNSWIRIRSPGCRHQGYTFYCSLTSYIFIVIDYFMRFCLWEKELSLTGCPMSIPVSFTGYVFFSFMLLGPVNFEENNFIIILTIFLRNINGCSVLYRNCALNKKKYIHNSSYKYICENKIHQNL